MANNPGVYSGHPIKQEDMNMKTMMDMVELTGEKVTGAYRKIENGVVGGYLKIQNGAVKGFTELMDACIRVLFTRSGESVEDAKARLSGRN